MGEMGVWEGWLVSEAERMVVDSVGLGMKQICCLLTM